MSNSNGSRNDAQQSVVVALQEAQKKSGYLSPEVMTELADSLKVPVNDVYGVASFYSFFSIKPVGRNVIRVCQNLPCELKNARVIIDTIAEELGIKPGQTTPDGRFSFELTNCIGLCDRPPAMLINDDPHVELTSEKIKQILQNYK